MGHGPEVAMRLELTDEQRMVQGLAREFAEQEVKPVAAECDREGRFPHATVKRMGELGLLGLMVPEKLGGSGADTLSYVQALEEIAVACASHAVVMSVNNSLVCHPLVTFGTPAQQDRFLGPLASGRSLGSFALTEPQAGSDARNLTTLARRDGDDYVLDGRKVFVTTGRESTVALVFAQTDPAKAHRGISAFLIEKGTPGFLVPRIEDKLGLRASDTAEFVFEGCRVPVANRLGAEGEGFKIAMGALDGGRIGIAAQAVGIARAALEASVAYAKERRSFGVPIGQHQQIQWMLADMATAVDAARLLTWRAALQKDRGEPYGVAASMAKLFASETAMRVATDAIQIHGGYGYMKEYPVERFFRDAKITQIYEGTSQIQRLVIGRSLLEGRRT
jgi:alkylation response protein AidB-like acyl-CoA dehydrogenase